MASRASPVSATMLSKFARIAAIVRGGRPDRASVSAAARWPWLIFAQAASASSADTGLPAVDTATAVVTPRNGRIDASYVAFTVPFASVVESSNVASIRQPVPKRAKLTRWRMVKCSVLAAETCVSRVSTVSGARSTGAKRISGAAATISIIVANAGAITARASPAGAPR